MSSARPLVLCIDDDERTLQILGKLLARLPVEYRLASEPEQAIRLARELRPHLLVLDLMLPGMSGWEVLDQIRDGSQRSDLRVLILTAKESRLEQLVAANVAQVDLFLSKPFDPLGLARQLMALLGLPNPGGPYADGQWPA